MITSKKYNKTMFKINNNIIQKKLKKKIEKKIDSIHSRTKVLYQII
jgi:hypothetical protein